MLKSPTESGIENFDPSNLSREQLRATVEVANSTLFRTEKGVVDIQGNETYIQGEGEGDDFRIIWHITPRIADYATQDGPGMETKTYQSFEAAMQSLNEACHQAGYSIREE